MEPIPQLIFNRLARREQVILAGIGVLHTEREAATVDSTGILTAPRTRVVLSRAEDTADENLSEAIAAESGIPLSEIRPQVHRWLTELKAASAGGALSIDGVVHVDASGQATPSPELNALLNPLGADGIRLPAHRPEPPKRRRRNLWWLWLLLLAVLATTGWYGYTRGWFTLPIDRSPAPVPEQPEPAPEPTIAADTVPLMPALSTLPADSTAQAEPTAEPVRETAYHLVGGVYSTRENAQRFIRQDVPTSLRPTIIPMSNGKFLVSLAHYPDKPTADREADRLRPDFPGIWVSKR
jgi:hypothetical protein